MPANSINQTFPIYLDTSGTPLESGFIYIGQINQNPEVNTKVVYWDKKLTVVASQPIRTIGGVAVRSGTPAKIYTDGDYSISVKDKNGVLVFTQSTPTEVANAIANVDSIASLLLLDTSSYSTVNVRGYYIPNDGGGDIFNYDATKSAINDGKDIFNGWVRQQDQIQDKRKAGKSLTGNPDINYNPFILVWMGQSNAVGTSETAAVGGWDDTIEQGVYAFSFSTFTWEQAVIGVSPLPSTLSNNAGIQFANEIKRRTGRDVFMVLNAQGGESIKAWVNPPSASGWDAWAGVVYPQGLTWILNAAGIDADNPIDCIGWMQGEADANGTTEGYATYGTYKLGLESLITMLKALPAVTGKTKFIASGIGEWEAMTQYNRNDVLQTLNNWEDPFVGNISTAGLVMNPNPGNTSHFDGESLTSIGKMMASKYLEGSFEQEVKKGINDQDGSSGFTYGGFLNNPNLQLEPAYLKGSAIIATNNSIFTLPSDPIRYDGAVITFEVTETSGGRSQIIGDFKYKGFSYTGVFLNKIGTWRFISTNGSLYLIQKPVSASNTYIAIVGAAVTPTILELENESYTVYDAIINLPNPTLTAGRDNLTGIRVSFYNYSITVGGFNGGNTTLQITGAVANKFKDKLGVTQSTLTMNAVGLITLLNIGGFWMVESQNF